ncbi:MAG: hypothetical protein ACYTFY_16015 [Planctomycetota bacterium]|jgi:hypothetical protein
MLLPALENALDSARKISCISNMKQQYTIMSFYAENNNDWLPGNANSNSPHRVSIGWTDGVSDTQSVTRITNTQPYVKESEWNAEIGVFFCPAAQRSDSWKKSKTDAYDAGKTTYFWLHNYPRGGAANLADPSKYTRWLTGGRMSRFSPEGGISQDWVTDPTSDSVQPDLHISNHNEGANVLQAQGAAGWEYEDRFLTGSYDGAAKANGLDKVTTYTFDNKAIDN